MSLDGEVGEAEHRAQTHALEMMMLEQETERLRAVKELVALQEAIEERRSNSAREIWLVQQRRTLQVQLLMRHRFSKGTFIFNLICEMTVELTFEKLTIHGWCQCWGAQQAVYADFNNVVSFFSS